MLMLILILILICVFVFFCLFVYDELDFPKDERIIEDVPAFVDAFRKSLIMDDLLPQKHDDYHMMLRFLKAKKFDIEKTKKMWADMLQWRKEFGADTIMEDFEFKELNEFVKYQPQCYHGVDKEGRPVFIFPACTIASKRQIDSITQIFDVQDIGLHYFLMDDEVRRFNLLVGKIYDDNYAWNRGQTFIINASNKFKLRWNTTYDPDPERASKIHVLGNDYQTKLLEIIDASELPTFLGGTCTCADQGGCLRSGKGPWRNPIILKMIHSGEARRISQPIKVLNSEEKVNDIDTSKAESRSEAEYNDISSPKTVKGYSHLRLTPVRDENPNNWLDPSDLVTSVTENRTSVLEKLAGEQGKLLTELKTDMGQIKELLLEFMKKTPPSEGTENLVKNVKTEDYLSMLG
ncbi:proteasome endopeptidase complex [Trifolium repens]|nr:proteasome endopeptidase complex [Trifolium repens]